VQVRPVVIASSILRYTVKLANTGRRPFLLEPCPSYEEAMLVQAPGSKVAMTRRNYYLNCDTVHVIAPQRSATFVMLMQVPDGSGEAKFAWQLHVPGTPAGGTGVRVLP
jgi:hypothetical protein